MYARKERLRIEKIKDELRRDVESMTDEFTYDSLNRRWAKCTLCGKKRPAWGSDNTHAYPCSCQEGKR